MNRPIELKQVTKRFGAITALVAVLPRILGETYALPPDLLPRGGLVESLERLAQVAPYVLGAILGLMVGMEIPLLARIRQSLHARHLTHNTGTIYGADYIGAGVGASVGCHHDHQATRFANLGQPRRAPFVTAVQSWSVHYLERSLSYFLR